MDVPPEVWRWIAAAAGGCTYPFVRPEPTWRRNLAVALIGTSVGILGAPWLCECADWHSPHPCNLISAAFGLIGMIAVKVGITTAESTLTPAWVTQLVYRLLGVPAVPPQILDAGTTKPDPPRRRRKRETDDDIQQLE